MINKIVCIGDSNTYGYDPRSFFGDKYDVSWVDVLRSELGIEVINDGVNGRCVPEVMEEYDESVFVIVMLGSNDLLGGLEVSTIVNKMRRYLGKHKVLLISPPVFKRGAWVESDVLVERSKALVDAFRCLAEELDILYFDTGVFELCYDGVHLTQEDHRELGERLAKWLKINAELLKL